MAITPDEKQSIVSAVLSSIRTNSRTIDQLTPVTSLSDSDSFEINGGKRVTYKVLRELIAYLNPIYDIGISQGHSAEGHPAKLFLYRRSQEPLSVPFPIATAEYDGLMTAAQVKELAEVRSLAEGMAVTKMEFLSSEENHVAAIGLWQGHKGVVSVSIPHATTARSGLMCRGQAIILDELQKDMPGIKESLTQAHSKAAAAMTQAIAALQLPRFSGIVVDALPDGTNVYNSGTGSSSSSPGCDVIYDRSCNRFLLRRALSGGHPTYYTLWTDADTMGLTLDMDPDLPRLYRASEGVAYMATKPPYGLYFLNEEGATLIPGSRPSVYEDFEKDVTDAITTAISDKVDKEEGKGLSNVMAGALQTSDNLPDIYTCSREQLKMDLFIDLFNTAAGTHGRYDPEKAPNPERPFMLNKLWFSYAQAVEIYNWSVKGVANNLDGPYQACRLSTVMPLRITSHSVSLKNAFRSSSLRRVSIIGPVYDSAIGFTGAGDFFADCYNLEEVVCDTHTFVLHSYSSSIFRNCRALREIRLRTSGGSFDIHWSPLLSSASVRSFIPPSVIQNGAVITVHPDVYAKLTGDTTNTAAAELTQEELDEWQQILLDATEKNITFATV